MIEKTNIIKSKYSQIVTELDDFRVDTVIHRIDVQGEVMPIFQTSF